MIIAVIPAKGESTRMPNKNMQSIAGKPMIYYSILFAKRSKLIDDIYVSTDSDEIEAYAKEHDIKVVRRGPKLSGETPVASVYLHALKVINNPEIKIVVGIQPDHPDRKLNVDEAIEYLLKKDYDELITVDRNGLANGSLKIMKSESLLNKRMGKVATMMDDCTNIHNYEDLKRAEQNLLQKRVDVSGKN
ncbi:MAG: cytidylyltransferase domain-containing protein [Candidatus Aminicenantaceae bacterium]